MEKKAFTDSTPNDIKIIDTISTELASLQNMDAVANFLKIISDPTRLKIIMILENHEVSVNDIAVLMNMTKSAVSHQLKVLKNYMNRGNVVVFILDILFVLLFLIISVISLFSGLGF